MTLSRLWVWVGIAVLPTLAQAEGVMRFYCHGDNAGAVLFINGKEKSRCPATIFLPAGRYVVTAIKPSGEEQEQRFEQSVDLQDDGVALVTVELSAPQLTKAAIQKRAEQAWQEVLATAGAGDQSAMQEVIRRFSVGDGVVPRNTASAATWQKRLLLAQQAEAGQLLQQAEAGDVAAMRQIAQRYRDGKGVAQSEEQAAAWEVKAGEKAAQEQAQAEQAKAIQDFTYFPIFHKLLDSQFHKSVMEMADPDKSLMAFTTTGIPMEVSWTVAGLMDSTSLPVNLTRHQQLKKRAAGHAAAWHEPDSLMAQAYARRTERLTAPQSGMLP